MKATKENVEILKRMGFVPETDCLSGWWKMDDNSLSFILDTTPSFRHLIQRLIKTHYNYGYDDGVDKAKRLYNMGK